jgi:dolichol-phosphate mannosyltransferase
VTAGGRALAFGLIGLSGFAPNLAALWLLTAAGVHYLAAEVLANQVAIAWNFLLLDCLLYQHRRRHHWSRRFAKFLAVANIDLIGRIPLLGLLVAHARMNVLLATAITLVAGFAVRFAVTDRFIYVARQARSPGRSAAIPAKKVTTP